MTRFGFVINTYAATLFVGLTSTLPPGPKLLWNASASVPIGLYAVRCCATNRMRGARQSG